jgi:hypothetical protein
VKKTFHVPIFECTVHIIVTDDIPGEHKKIFEPDDDIEDYEGCVAYHGSKFALFIEPKVAKNPNTLHHEIFHLTHRILEYRDINFDKDHHETGALLHGWLTQKILKILQP